jgi:hypothetical protein
LAAFVAGFDWARQNNFELLVKFSRRFIPLFDWVRELQELAFITQYATYSSRCVHYDFGFRTECIAMHVQSWFMSGAVEKIREQVISNESAFVEKFIHDLAREVHKGNCEQNRQFEKFADKPYSVAAYGDWMLSGISRHLPRPNVLWNRHSRAMKNSLPEHEELIRRFHEHYYYTGWSFGGTWQQTYWMGLTCRVSSDQFILGEWTRVDWLIAAPGRTHPVFVGPAGNAAGFRCSADATR